MKKSFLQTFIVLGLFSIFLFGSFNFTYAYVVDRWETFSSEKINGKTVEGSRAYLKDDTGKEVGYQILYREVGSTGFYKGEYYIDGKHDSSLDFSQRYATPEQEKAGEQKKLEEKQQQEANWKAQIDAAKAAEEKKKQEEAAAKEGANDNWFENGIQTLAMSILIYGSKFVSWLVGFVGFLFDKVIEYTTTYPESLSQGITNSWKIIRDFSNIILVFSLLYLGIKTIIEGQGFADKKTLVGIIIAAILINFSLVFVRDVAFNISNTVGLQILQQSGTGTDNALSTPSTQLMSIINPQQVLNMNGFNAEWGASNIAVNDRTGWGLIAKMTGQFFMFTSIVLAMGVVFLGASIILLYRFMIFIVLMIASPFGLISTQIPWLQKYGKDWSEQLKKQTIIFPAFMLILYLVLLIVTTLASYNPITLNATNTTTTEIFNFLFNFILIIGFLISLLILPGKIGAAGADLMTNAAGWTTKKIKSMPRSFAQGTGRMAVKTTQFGAGVGSSALGRTGRYVFGNKVANRIGGKTEDDVKALKKTAQGTGWSAWKARRRLDIAEALKGKTYDMRNIDAVKKSKFGKGMGTGIESYTDAIKTRTKEFEKTKKTEMERYGYDKAHETDEAKKDIRQYEAERTRKEEVYKRAEIAFKASGSDIDLQRMNTAKDELEEAELAVGMAKNVGEVRYMVHDAKRWTQRVQNWAGERNSFIGRNTVGAPVSLRMRAAESIKKDYEKKWKEKGQSKDKKKSKRENDWIENGGTPPPVSSSSTSSTPTVTTTVGSSGGTTTT